MTKFVIHHLGGGWCTSIENCFDRGQAKTYGSSEDWRSTVVCELEDGGSFDDVKKPTPTPLKGSLPCHADGGMHGLLSPDPAANPMTYNWNKVFIGYCDGASMGGNVDKPVPVPDSKDVVFFRGRAILDAAYDKLLDKLDLNHATDVLVSGSSAGGLTVFRSHPSAALSSIISNAFVPLRFCSAATWTTSLTRSRARASSPRNCTMLQVLQMRGFSWTFPRSMARCACRQTRDLLIPLPSRTLRAL